MSRPTLEDIIPSDRIRPSADIDEFVTEVLAAFPDIVEYAKRVAPQVSEGHEDEPQEQHVAVGLFAGMVVGWHARKHLEAPWGCCGEWPECSHVLAWVELTSELTPPTEPKPGYWPSDDGTIRLEP